MRTVVANAIRIFAIAWGIASLVFVGYMFWAFGQSPEHALFLLPAYDEDRDLESTALMFYGLISFAVTFAYLHIAEDIRKGKGCFK